MANKTLDALAADDALAVDAETTGAPSSDRARTQDSDRSRRIVEAADQLLEQEGLEGLTIRAVLKRTGLSRRAFYERFEGKDDLVLAVFEETIRRAAETYAHEAAALPDPMERLKLIVTCIVLGRSGLQASESAPTDRRGAALSREHLRLAESRPNDLQAALRPLISLIADQLSAGVAAGQVRDCAPQRVATLVYNLLSTTVHAHLLAEEGAEPDMTRRAELAAEIWEFCRRAVAA